MIPVLYSPTETDFTSNGLGKLADAVTCIVTEERNGQYELEMTYSITGVHFAEIAISSLIKAVPAEGKPAQLFRVYKITKPRNGIVSIDAEHISYQLSHIPVSPFEAGNVISALSGLKENAAEDCPFEFWTDKTTSASFSVKEPVSIRSRLGGTEGSILDAFGGGEYEFDNYTVKLHQNRGYDGGVTLRYSKNITDIKQEENIASTYTGVMPYWKGTNDSQEEYVVMLDEKVLHSSNAKNFPYQRTVPLDLSGEFESEPTKAQLKSRAQSYMAANDIGVPSVSIDVSFVALWQTEEYKDIANLERVNLCDTVLVYFPKLEIAAKAKVIKTVYNVLKDRYDSIELGEAKSTLAQSVKSDIQKSASSITEGLPTKSFLKSSLDRATKLLTGGLGGFVVFNYNADGEPQELLIMDTDDIQTAVNVIRLNKNGIGFSTNGYDGPFISAWTIDGKFNADFIAAGSILASMIKGGTLSLGGEDNAYGLLEILNSSGQNMGSWGIRGVTVSDRYLNTLLSAGGMININGTPYYGIEYKSNDTDGNMAREVLFLQSMNIGANGLKKYGIRHYKDVMMNGLISSGSFNNMQDVYYAWGGGNQSNYDYRVDVAFANGVGIKSTKYGDSTSVVTLTVSDGGIYFASGSNAYNRLNINLSSRTFVLFQKNVAFESTSSKRFKHDILPLKDKELNPHRLLDLRPVQFVYNDDHPLQYDDMKGQMLPGFIAEDVAEIYPAAVIHDADGEIESWDERRIIPGMLALIQEQHKEIESLKKRLDKLEKIIEKIGGDLV